MSTTIQKSPPASPDPEEELESGKAMSFLEHLEELRKRLLSSVIAVLVATAVCFLFRNTIYAFLARPLTESLKSLHHQPKLVYTNPVDPFNLYVELALMGGIFLASPFVLWQLWLFVSPGLYRHEKRYVWPFIFLTSSLFVTGGFFAYKLALPAAMHFLVSFGHQFTPMVTINEYWDLAIRIILAVGLVFELPVVIMVLAAFGIITPKFLLKNVKYAILLTAVLAAAIVPSNDLYSLFVVWIPLIGLYILSIGLAWIVQLRRKRKAKHEAV